MTSFGGGLRTTLEAEVDNDATSAISANEGAVDATDNLRVDVDVVEALLPMLVLQVRVDEASSPLVSAQNGELDGPGDLESDEGLDECKPYEACLTAAAFLSLT
jgi:hypothetical protein